MIDRLAITKGEGWCKYGRVPVGFVCDEILYWRCFWRCLSMNGRWKSRRSVRTTRFNKK